MKVILLIASKNSDMVSIHESLLRYSKINKLEIFLNDNKIENKLSFNTLIEILKKFFIYFNFIAFKNKSCIYVFENSHVLNIPLLFLVVLFNRNRAHIIHDSLAHPGRGGSFVNLYHYLVKFFFKNIILFSPNNKYKNSKIIYLGGYDSPDFKIDRLIAFEDRYFDFIFFGRIEQYKRVHIFLQIARTLFERGMSYRFALVGSGKITDYWADKIPPNVTFVNKYITNLEKINYFSDAKYVILPYSSVTQSGVLVECLLYGCVPVCQKGIGFEYYGNIVDAVFFDFDSELETICHQLMLLTNISYSAYNQQKKYLDNFSSKVFAEQFDKCILDFMEK